MSDLVFPQLSSGAMVQYPLRRRRVLQSPLNAFADGTMVTSDLNRNSQTIWELSYRDLTDTDRMALQNHFVACHGPLFPFTFIDPTGNMLSASSDFNPHKWRVDPLVSVLAGAPDPFGGTNAFNLVNTGQTDQSVSQQIAAPSNLRYCLSVYASSAESTTLTLGRSAVSVQREAFPVGSSWTRLVHSSQMTDSQTAFTVSLTLPAGQSLLVFGPQLEPQITPSRYRPTAVSGGVYPDAHLLGDSITFESEAPGLFSTFISIETT